MLALILSASAKITLTLKKPLKTSTYGQAFALCKTFIQKTKVLSWVVEKLNMKANYGFLRSSHGLRTSETRIKEDLWV